MKNKQLSDKKEIYTEIYYQKYDNKEVEIILHNTYQFFCKYK